MNDHLKTHTGALLGAVITFFILLFIYTKLAGPIPFTVNNINTSTETPFQVEGQGSASGVPDEATISFGVTSNASSVGTAQEQTNSRIDAIIENLRNLGISDDDIKTTNYSVNPNYNFEGTQRITGYSVTQNIELKLENIENVNRVVDTVTSNGANLVGQIQFGFSESSKRKLEEEARKQAYENAKQKAESIAKVTGVNLGKIINVNESQAGGERPIPFLDRAISEGTEPANDTNITPGEGSIELVLILTYEIN